MLNTLVHKYVNDTNDRCVVEASRSLASKVALVSILCKPCFQILTRLLIVIITISRHVRIWKHHLRLLIVEQTIFRVLSWTVGFCVAYSCLETLVLSILWGICSSHALESSRRVQSYINASSRDKMVDNSQPTCSFAFPGMKIGVFWLWFHWSMFPNVRLDIRQHWFR